MLFFFSFSIDSGGPIGIRYIFISLMLLYLFYYICTVNRKVFIEKITLISIFIFYLFIVFGFFSATLNGISLTNTVTWLLPISMLFPFLLFLSNVEKLVLINSYISGMLLFSVLILTVFFLSLMLPKEISYALLSMLDGKYGMFYMRDVSFIPYINQYPNVYFQATLSLVPAAIFAYFSNRKITYYIILVSLSLALSRFGLFSVLLCVFFIKYNVFSDKHLFGILIILLPSVLGVFIFIYLLNYSSYVNDETGISIRLGHLISVFGSLDLTQLLYGMGPGSDYYSLGFEKIVDNIEVSQLEVVRKYGIIGFFLFHLAISGFLFGMLKKGSEYIYPLLSFYLVSFSNPTLLSFQLPIILSISLISSKEVKREKYA